ncbi:MAG: hypothetical protein WBL31_13210, partial [Ilumatobacteraceae bacterium]
MLAADGDTFVMNAILEVRFVIGQNRFGTETVSRTPWTSRQESSNEMKTRTSYESDGSLLDVPQESGSPCRYLNNHRAVDVAPR